MMRNVFLTGGSRGIGAAAVLALARAGYNVAFTYHAHPEAAEAVAAQARALSPAGTFLPICADAGDSAQVCAAVAQAEEALGSLQVLVCNAGIAQQKLFTDTTDEDWHAHDGRGSGRCLLCLPRRAARHDPAEIRAHCAHQQYVGPDRRQLRGSLQRCQSRADRPGPSALAKEEGPSGVTVNIIAPGVIDTDMMASFTDEDRAALAEETPVERLGTAEDVARAIVFLCDENAGYITGQVLGVNGGLVI